MHQIIIVIKDIKLTQFYIDTLQDISKQIGMFFKNSIKIKRLSKFKF